MDAFTINRRNTIKMQLSRTPMLAAHRERVIESMEHQLGAELMKLLRDGGGPVLVEYRGTTEIGPVTEDYPPGIMLTVLVTPIKKD